MSTGTASEILPDDVVFTHQSSVEEATNNFYYKDASVRLCVGDKIFSVSRNLLTMRSPVFRQMLSLPQDEHRDEVVLHNDPEDMRAFLVYLHSEIVDSPSYDSKSQTNVIRLLGIAAIAHMYEFTSAAEWAIQKALDLAPACTGTDHAGSLLVLCKLLSTTSHWDSATPYRARSVALARFSTSITTQAVLRQPTSQHADPHPLGQMIARFEAIGELEMVSWLYYHLLVYFDNWQSVPWLRAADRHRLLCGHYELSRNNVSLKRPQSTSFAAQCVELGDRVGQTDLWPKFDPSKWAIAETPQT